MRADLIERSGAVDLDRDRKLVLRYQAGDQSAFDELYRRYYPRLHLYCQRRVGDAHTAEELAQDAFLKALRAMPSFAGERRFYPWMTVIAQRLCIDHHRRTARVEPSAEIDLGTFEDDHDELFASVDRDHLEAALARLAPRHREVLDLRETQAMTYDQIATRLDVPITTVEALLHRARKALRREFMSVSNGGRLAGIPIIGWAVAGIGRLRSRFGGHSLGQTAAVVAPAAVAAVAAITVALAPSGAGPTVATAVPPSTAVAAPVALSVPALAADASTAPAPSAPAVAPHSTSSSAPSASTGAAPPPDQDYGVAQVYTQPDAVHYWNQQILTEPHVDLGALGRAGVDPQLVGAVQSLLGGGS